MTFKNILRRNMILSSTDGIFYSLMVGLGETYLSAFVLAAGASDTQSGLVTVVPLLLGSVLQLVSPFGIRTLGSYRRWVTACSSTQALSLCLIGILAQTRYTTALVIFSSAAMYWASGMATGPAWNAWVSSIIPKSLRTAYFSKRSRYIQAFTLIGLLGAGWSLHHVKAIAPDRVLDVFAFLFFGAGLCRFISSRALALQTEPENLAKEIEWIPLRQVIAELPQRKVGGVYIYLVVLAFSVHMAGPYFTPFLLSQLKFSYSTYSALVAASFFGKVVALPWFSDMCRRFGPSRVLLVGAMGIAVLPLLWILSTSEVYFLFVQFFSGVFWSAQELAVLLYFFDQIPAHQRTSYLAAFNLLNTIGMVSGALVGGYLLKHSGESFDGYVRIFSVSTVLRVGTLLFLPRILRIQITPVKWAIRVLGMRPVGGPMIRPVFTDEGEEEGEKQPLSQVEKNA